jgi:uncharacterized protein (TIGR02117 family)
VKLLRRLVGAILALAALYVAAALLLGLIPTNRDFAETPGGIPVAVCSNGVHTDFVLPVRNEVIDWTALFSPANYPFDVARFDHIGVGWGDLDFYRSTPRWADFELGIALKALTGLGPAALHVQYRPGPGANEDCRATTISTQQYEALSGYIAASIASPVPAAPGYGGSDLFYPAQGRFSLIESCNVWVGRGLQAAGLPTGLWTPFSFQVLSHL